MRKRTLFTIALMTVLLLSGCSRQDRLRRGRNEPVQEETTEEETTEEETTEEETTEEETTEEETTEEETTEEEVYWFIETAAYDDAWYEEESSEEETEEDVDPWKYLWGEDPDDMEDADWNSMWSRSEDEDWYIAEGEDEYVWKDIEVVNNEDAPTILPTKPRATEPEDDAPFIATQAGSGENQSQLLGPSAETLSGDSELPLNGENAENQISMEAEISQEETSPAIQNQDEEISLDASPANAVPEASVEEVIPVEEPDSAPTEEEIPLEPAATAAPETPAPTAASSEAPATDAPAAPAETVVPNEVVTEAAPETPAATEPVKEPEHVSTNNGETVTIQIPEAHPIISSESRIQTFLGDGTLIGESRYGEAPWSLLEEAVPADESWTSACEIIVPIPGREELAISHGIATVDFMLITQETVYSWKDEINLETLAIRLYQSPVEGESAVLIVTPPEGTTSIRWSVSDATMATVPELAGVGPDTGYGTEEGQYAYAMTTLAAGNVSVKAEFLSSEGIVLGEGGLRVRIHAKPAATEPAPAEEAQAVAVEEEVLEEAEEETTEAKAEN